MFTITNQDSGLTTRVYISLLLLQLIPLLRLHLDYRDVIFDQSLNEYLCNRIESVQYKAALAITGAKKDHLKKRYIRNYV